MKKLIYLFLLLFFFEGFVNAQNHDAELFFNDGTSLTGYAMLHKNDKIKFRLTLDDKPDIWTNLMVEKIVFSFLDFNVTFKYIKVKANKPPQLLKVVTDGKVTLYARVLTKPSYDRGYVGNNSYNMFNHHQVVNGKWMTNHKIKKHYVQRSNEEFPTLLSRNFKKSAEIYFFNCIGLSEKLTTGEFRYFKLKEMVDYYNSYCAE